MIEITRDGRKFREIRNAYVFACIETGEVIVIGNPYDVMPEDWPDEPTDEQRESELAHNCDAAGCSSVSHRIAVGRIAGRPVEK